MRTLLFIALVLVVLRPGWAQDLAATIQAEGTATLLAQPERVEFVLKFREEGLTFEEAARKVESVEEALRSALEEADLSPLEISLGALQIRRLSQPVVEVSAILHFPIRRLVDDADRAAEFAKLCDRINGIARDVKAVAEGPILKVDNPEGFEQEALQRATENALYRADAISAIMKSQIYAVQSVEILGVEWVRSAGDPATAPDLDRLACVAKVNVVYSLAPR